MMPDVKLNFSMNDASFKVLTEIKEKIDAPDYATVLRNALKLYDSILTAVEKGNAFYTLNSKTNNSKFETFIMFEE